MQDVWFFIDSLKYKNGVWLNKKIQKIEIKRFLKSVVRKYDFDKVSNNGICSSYMSDNLAYIFDLCCSKRYKVNGFIWRLRKGFQIDASSMALWAKITDASSPFANQRLIWKHQFDNRPNWLSVVKEYL